MRLSRVWTCVRMTARELGRNRLVIGLAFLLPVVFFAVVYATTGDRIVPITLAGASDQVYQVAERRESLMFIAIAAAGLLSAFFAASLIQRRLDVNRRLVLCGYRPVELIVARLGVLLVMILLTALYLWVLLAFAAGPGLPLGVPLGVALGAFVYGCYGLLVGTAFRHDLETVFAILVLINIDAGWLQNPIYYATAQSKWLIRVLPGHLPAQTAYVAAFADAPIRGLALHSLWYGGALLALAVGLYAVRMGVRR